MARLNKSTGLFGMGDGRRAGAKSKIGDFLDQLRKKRKKTSKSNAKSRAEDVKDVYKYSKKDSIKAYKDQGMSRSEAKDQTMKDAESKVKSNRSKARAVRKSDRAAISAAKAAADAKKREEARASGQKLAYDVTTASSPAEQREMAPGGTPTKRLKGNENVSFDDKKGMYKITSGDGYVRYSKSKPAMYGAKVKTVKKAKAGAALKSVPSKAKGLSKLPKGVRNKMGYMKHGGKVKSKSFGVLKSDTNKSGPKMEPGKEPYTKNGITYTWDRKNSVWRGDAGKGLNKKTVAVKKTKK